MNDDEMITTVQESVTNVHMTVPVDQITSRSRAIRARRRVPGLAGALAVVAAAAVAVTTWPGHGTNAAPVLTARLLADRAAAAALSQPYVKPGQWVYREIKWRFTPRDPGWTGTESTWTTAAGKRAYVGGAFFQVAIGALPYSKLGSLPSNPAALEKYLGDTPLVPELVGSCVRGMPPRVVKCPPRRLPRHLTRSGHAVIAFTQIQGLLWKYVLPPKLAAEVFRALAYVPGIRVRRDTTDIAGQHGVAFVLPGRQELVQRGGTVVEVSRGRLGGSSLELIVSPRNYRLMAMSRTMIFFMTRDRRVKIFDAEAIIRQAFVSRPGVLP